MGLLRLCAKYFSIFLKDEKGQSTIEYILIAGAIIIAVIIFFPIYREIAGKTAEKTNEDVVATGRYTYNSVKREITNL